MSDTISIHGLECLGFCGALPEEQQRRQPFQVDLDIEADLSRAAASDDLADTIDYGAVCAAVDELFADGRYVLMERLAEQISDAVLAFELVEQVTVTVTKLRPPVPSHLAASSVTICRTR